jgi:hypothetical protein
MGLIQRLFGGLNPPALSTPSQLPHAADTTTVEIDSQAATRRELVRMLTRDSLRFSGLPDGWIELQVLLELGRGGQTFIHLRLLVRHWDEGLFRYAVALQRRLRAEIERFEPSAREWLLTITWQYEVDDQCPFLFMPDAASWGAVNPETGAATEQAPSAEVREEAEMQSDLARLFAVRDANLTGQEREATGLAGRSENSPGAARSSGASPGRPHS